MTTYDSEQNRMAARAMRYTRVATNLGGVAARIVGSRLLGQDKADARHASALTEALGGLKGPLMKVAQLLATIPDALPPEYAAELATLQSNAPPMGAAFVKRRMMAELGAAWRQQHHHHRRGGWGQLPNGWPQSVLRPRCWAALGHRQQRHFGDRRSGPSALRVQWHSDRQVLRSHSPKLD